jgi:hypothetical protein
LFIKKLVLVKYLIHGQLMCDSKLFSLKEIPNITKHQTFKLVLLSVSVKSKLKAILKEKAIL